MVKDIMLYQSIDGRFASERQQTSLLQEQVIKMKMLGENDKGGLLLNWKQDLIIMAKQFAEIF